ncbi:MAG TPA: DUF4907 domain-containing protein [Chitinophagaceae bacterium]|nr:DUF4907 domain-containing protein [Chitinophagaceae bacterium]
MKKYIPLLFIFTFPAGILFSAAYPVRPNRELHRFTQDTTYRIFPAGNKVYGFDILIGKTVFIHQPFIPAVPGNQGFTCKTDAIKTARLMLFKLKRHEMPPAISASDLDSLHIHLHQ